MKALVFHEVGVIKLEEVPQPKLLKTTDAIVRITKSAICGTDLHMVRGTMSGMKPGTILGHEGVGIVEEVGPQVRNFKKGDRVVVTSTIACGSCSYCRSGEFAQCDKANPNGPRAGTAFFGGPEDSGPFNGMQAEFVRVPFANVNMVRLPSEVSDDQAILLSDIFPTGYMAAKNAEIKNGNLVAVFGCGPVGLFSILSARILGAGRVFAIDRLKDRLDKARDLGAECVNFDREDPIETLRELSGGIGPDRVIDAVGVDAEGPHAKHKKWEPGHAPAKALEWCVRSVRKAGTISIIGVYGEESKSFPIGAAMNKNLTIKMGNCNHRRYVEQLIELVAAGVVEPLDILTQKKSLGSVVQAYEAFDERKEGWIKVELEPAI